MAHFEAEQVFQRGINCDWKNHDPGNDVTILNLIFSKTPKILDGYTQEQIEILRPAAAMIHLWGTNAAAKQYIIPDFFTSSKYDANTSVNMILLYALFLYSINRYKISCVKSVEIVTAPDSCENCKKHAGKTFNIDMVPELPYAACTHKYGCRCCIVPKVL